MLHIEQSVPEQPAKEARLWALAGLLGKNIKNVHSKKIELMSTRFIL
jgi:hypothetical protein